MNDYESMKQQVDQIRDTLKSIHKVERNLAIFKSNIMEELLDTRRQITRADKQAKLVLGSR